MNFYPEPNTSTWLFGGIFEVLAISAKPCKVEYNGGESYKQHGLYWVKLTEQSQELIGRLKIDYQDDTRKTRKTCAPQNHRVNIEKYYNKLQVKEILPQPYTG